MSVSEQVSSSMHSTSNLHSSLPGPSTGMHCSFSHIECLDLHSELNEHPFSPSPGTITHCSFWQIECFSPVMQSTSEEHSFSPAPGTSTHCSFWQTVCFTSPSSPNPGSTKFPQSVLNMQSFSPCPRT